MKRADVVLAIKEIPVEVLESSKTYLFFSHTIKGQPDNMPALRRLMELGCTLMDYELITDEEGRRLVLETEEGDFSIEASLAR